eukprot:3121149-Rhodomonas_salina.2
MNPTWNSGVGSDCAKIGAEGRNRALAVQRGGCAALHKLSFNCDNRVVIEAKGGIEVLTAAMRKYAACQP